MKIKFHIVLIALAGLIGLGSTVSAQTAPQPKRYTVMFYNLENLFDTIKSPGVFDEEFLPSGAKAWNSQKYWKKMSNLGDVFYNVAKDTGGYPTIIGVSEVENRNVLEDLVMEPKIAKANYQIVHYDSPDARGVDVALLYRPDYFKYEGSQPLPVVNPEDLNWKTRDVLMVWGKIEGETFYFFVNHWPSRLGGQAASEHKRMLAAAVVKHATDSVMLARPDVKIAVMGDLNDDPTDKSIAITLGAKGKSKELGKADLYNPYYDMLKAGFGTLFYNDNANIFDNIIVNENLVNATTGNLKLYKPETNKYYGNIFDRPWLRQTSGTFKNYPLRTFVGNTFMAGYSDHFPVFIYIAK